MLGKLLLSGVLAASIGTGSIALASSNQASTNHSKSTPTSVTSHGHDFGSFKGHREGSFGLFKEAATVLRVDQITLISDLKSGQSLADIASSKNMDKTTLINKLVAAEKIELDQAVTKGTITVTQETKWLNKATTRITKLVDQKGLFQKEFHHGKDKEIDKSKRHLMSK